LPAQIQEALGELVGAAREGLLALSVGVGLGVVHELMELEVEEVVGPKGKHNPDRSAKRHGHEDGSLTLGGRRVRVRRPRMRTADDERELPVQAYEYFADRDPLARAVMDRMLAGVSSRKFAQVGEPVGSEVEQSCSATSKTSVSEMFVDRTATALGDLMSRRLEDVRLAVMMIDGMEIAERTHVVALGIGTGGVKIPLGLWEGSTENATLARTLLADLVDRGLDPEQAILFVVDGGKALRRAIKDVFGEHALVHRCHRHKECHEEGPPAGADCCVGDNPEGGPWWSSMSDSIGDTDAHAGARRRAMGRCWRRTGRRPTRTGLPAWQRGLAPR
jgi:transposase-like protein